MQLEGDKGGYPETPKQSILQRMLNKQLLIVSKKSHKCPQMA